MNLVSLETPVVININPQNTPLVLEHVNADEKRYEDHANHETNEANCVYRGATSHNPFPTFPMCSVLCYLFMKQEVD